MQNVGRSDVGRVFVSHAAADKSTRIKPLVRALLHEGIALWLDRPGVGDSHFGFDDAFVRHHGIRGLNAGEPWDDGIVRALRECDAVLLCLSRVAISAERLVIRQEVFTGRLRDNLVACIVDELGVDELPTDGGLAFTVRTQCERIDSASLEEALTWLDQHPDERPAQLPASLQAVWEPVRSLRRHLEQACGRSLLFVPARTGPFSMAPPPPPYWVDRPELTSSVARLLEVKPCVLLHGLPGAGKSALAARIANDAAVQKRFASGGVLWAELGQEPDLLALVQRWVGRLDPGASLAGDLASLADRLFDLLRPPCLLVLDDVWDPVHLKSLVARLPSDCRVLVTARRETVARDLCAEIVPVGPLTQDQALKLLRQHMGPRWAGTGAPQSPRPAEVAAALGNLAEALKLLAARVRAAEDWERMHQAVVAEVASLEALVGAREQLRGESRLEAMVHLSLRALRADSALAYETFLRLGVLHEDAEFGSLVVARLSAAGQADPDVVLQFLHEDALLLNGAVPRRYRLHDVLRHVARRLLVKPAQLGCDDELPGLGLTIADAHRDFVQCVRAGAALWHTFAPDGYSHEHLVRHLERAGAVDELHRLLAEDGAAGGNGWHEAREGLGQTAGYLADLARAQALVSATHDTIDRDAGRACRYALMRASLRSIAGSIPPTLVARLVALDRWPAGQALAYIESMPWDAQLDALAALAPQLDSATCRQLLRRGSRRDDELDWRWLRRAAILVPGLDTLTRGDAWRETVDELLGKDRLYDVMADDVARRLVDAGLPADLAAQLFDAAAELLDSHCRDRLFAALAPLIAADRLERALREAPDALHRLAPALAAQGAVHARRAFRLALTAARGDADRGARVIEALAPHLSGILLGRARVVARRSTDLGTRFHTQVALVGQLAKQRRADEARQLMAEARAPFDGRFDSLQAFARLLAARAPSLRPSEVVRALRDLKRLEGEAGIVCDLLQALAAHLHPVNLPEAFELLARNADHWNSDAARSALFAALVTKRGGQHALDAAAALDNDGERAQALEAIAPAIDDGDLGRCLELAGTLAAERPRAAVVGAVAARLPVTLAQRALALVRGVRDESERLDAAVALAAHLPPLRREALHERVLADADATTRTRRQRELWRYLGTDFWQARLDGVRHEPDDERRRETLNMLLDAAPDGSAVVRWLGVAGGGDDGAWLDAVRRLIDLGATDHAWALARHVDETSRPNPYWLGQALVELAPHLPADDLGLASQFVFGLIAGCGEEERSESAADAAAALATRLVALQRQGEAWALLESARGHVDALLAPRQDGSRRLSAPPLSNWPEALESVLGGPGINADAVLEAAHWIPDWCERAQAVVRVLTRLGRPLPDEMIVRLVVWRMTPAGEVQDWARVLPVIAGWLGPLRCEQFVARAFELVQSDAAAGNHVCLSVVKDLARWWPGGQLEAGLESCSHGNSGIARARAVGALLRRALEVRGPEFVLTQLRKMAGEELAIVLVEVAPVFAPEHFDVLLKLSIGLRKSPGRIRAIGAVALCLAARPADVRAQALHLLLSAAEHWSRPELVESLVAFAPALGADGDDAALRELAEALDDVGRWWL